MEKDEIAKKGVGPWPMDQAAQALERAAEAGDAMGAQKALDCFRALGDGGFWVSGLQDARGRTPLMLAARSGSLDTVRALIGACDPNGTDYKKQTALMIAAERGDLEMVKTLAEKSNVLAADILGDTALFAAFTGDHLPVVEFLAGMNGLTNRNSFRETPLLAAVSAGASKCAVFLIDHCDPEDENSHGETALGMAIERDMPEIAEVLARVSGVGSRAFFREGAKWENVFQSARFGAEKCLALFLPAMASREDWLTAIKVADAEGAKDIFAWMASSSAEPEKKRACCALLAGAVPLEIGRAVVERGLGKDYPELLARIEAAELAQTVADAQSGNGKKRKENGGESGENEHSPRKSIPRL